MTGRQAASIEDLPEPDPETVIQTATYWGYRGLWESIASMPEPLQRRLPKQLGRAWYAAAKPGQKAQVERNLSRVTGHAIGSKELDVVVKDAFISYARYWVDAFRLHTLDADRVLARTVNDKVEMVDEILAEGKGAIMATAHLGSWDVGAFFTSQRSWGMTVVAEVVEPRRLFERFVQLRRDAGLGVIPLVRGGDMINRLEDVVERGGLATLLADRDLGRKGPVVEFFGEPCRLPPGTAVLARRTKRPVAIAAFVTQGDGWRGVIQEVVDISHLSVEDGTQRIAQGLEDLIGRYPEQWHVFVRNWLVEREPDHPALQKR